MQVDAPEPVLEFTIRSDEYQWTPDMATVSDLTLVSDWRLQEARRARIEKNLEEAIRWTQVRAGCVWRACCNLMVVEGQGGWRLARILVV
jgi:hypothetical protein